MLIFSPEKLMALTKITELLFSSKYLDKRRHFCMREALFGDSKLLPVFPLRELQGVC